MAADPLPTLARPQTHVWDKPLQGFGMACDAGTISRKARSVSPGNHDKGRPRSIQPRSPVSWTQDPAFWVDMTQKGLSFEQNEQQLDWEAARVGKGESRQAVKKRTKMHMSSRQALHMISS